jgi:hypothetical protein
VSNIFTTLSQAEDKLSAIQSMGATAATQINAGALSHGTGAILEVALISSAIWQGALSYDTDQGSNVFDITKAVAAARLTYGRYADVYGHGEGNPFPTKGATSLSGWRNRVLAMLHPYSWNGSVLPWQKSNKQAETDIMKLTAGKTAAQITQMKKDVKNALDNVDKMRAKALKFFDYACLYCALDDNGSLLQASNTDPKGKAKDFGLLMRVSYFVPTGKVPTVFDADELVTLMPVDQRSGAITHVKKEYTEVGGKRSAKVTDEKETRVSFAGFSGNWVAKARKVEPQSGTSWTDALRMLAELTPDTDLPPDAIKMWNDTFAKIVAFNNALEIKRNGVKPEVKPDPKTMTAREISEGKSLTPSMRVAS